MGFSKIAVSTLVVCVCMAASMNAALSMNVTVNDGQANVATASGLTVVLRYWDPSFWITTGTTGDGLSTDSTVTGGVCLGTGTENNNCLTTAAAATTGFLASGIEGLTNSSDMLSAATASTMVADIAGVGATLRLASVIVPTTATTSGATKVVFRLETNESGIATVVTSSYTITHVVATGGSPTPNGFTVTPASDAATEHTSNWGASTLLTDIESDFALTAVTGTYVTDAKVVQNACVLNAADTPACMTNATRGTLYGGSNFFFNAFSTYAFASVASAGNSADAIGTLFNTLGYVAPSSYIASADSVGISFWASNGAANSAASNSFSIVTRAASSLAVGTTATGSVVASADLAITADEFTNFAINITSATANADTITAWACVSLDNTTTSNDCQTDNTNGTLSFSTAPDPAPSASAGNAVQVWSGAKSAIVTNLGNVVFTAPSTAGTVNVQFSINDLQTERVYAPKIEITVTASSNDPSNDPESPASVNSAFGVSVFALVMSFLAMMM